MNKTGVDLVKESIILDGAANVLEWERGGLHSKHALELVASATIREWNTMRDQVGLDQIGLDPKINSTNQTGKKLVVASIKAKILINVWRWHGYTEKERAEREEKARNYIQNLPGNTTLSAIGRMLSHKLEELTKKMDARMRRDEADIARGGPQKRHNESLISKAAILQWRDKEASAQQDAISHAKRAIAEHAEAQQEDLRCARARRALERKEKRQTEGQETSRAKRRR